MNETTDQLWSDAYYIAVVGASNPRGVSYTYNRWLEKGIAAEHPALRAIKGHLDFLHGTALGPDFDDFDLVKANAVRLGLVT
jgi:hypothetical protein